jgi:NAD(P)-dependent dehydrogenase (short-subunit alcohol dehydrogenase family)
VIGLTKSAALEAAAFGVRVNAVAPGYVDAPMAHELFRDESTKRKALERVPQARLGTTREIAAVVSFLCSPLASYVTGAVVPVDGGWSALGSAR